MLVKRSLRVLIPSSKVARSLTSLVRAQRKIKFLSQTPKLMSSRGENGLITSTKESEELRYEK